MPATAAAAITTTPMIRGGEHHQTARIEIKIARHRWQRTHGSTLAMKRRHAAGAEAGFVTQLCRNARQQFVRDVRRHAPARTFVGGGGAKLAAVGSTAERALAGFAGLLADWIGGEVIHLAANENAPVADRPRPAGFKSLVFPAREKEYAET